MPAEILTERGDELEIIAKGLLEYETLSGGEVRTLLRGEDIHKDDDHMPAPKPGGRRSSVPTSGKSKEPGSPGIGREPQPET